MNEQISPEIQQNIQSFQESQQQLRAILSQKYQFEIQVKESENALKELNSMDDKGEVHKAIGQILIRSNKKTVVDELTENKELLNVRLKSLESQEKKLSEKLKSLQDRLQGVI